MRARVRIYGPGRGCRGGYAEGGQIRRVAAAEIPHLMNSTRRRDWRGKRLADKEEELAALNAKLAWGPSFHARTIKP